jgi:hypothetical protein
MVNIEGEKLNIIPQQDKTNMTGGKIWHFNLPCEWGSHCLTVAASLKHGTARRLSTTIPKKTPFVEWGGGKEVFVESPKHGTARHLSPPYPPTHVREKSTLPKHGTARPLTPPKNPPFVLEWGGGGTGGVHRGASPKNGTASRLSPPRKNPPYYGGNRGDSPWRCPRTTLQVAYPPLEKPTIRVLMGGGEGGVHRGVAHAWHCTSPIPPLPPLMSGIIKN